MAHGRMAAAEPAVAIEGLAVRYGRTPALEGVSLSLAPGETLGLIGANGAGKTTLVGAVLGAIPPAAGAVRVFGAAAASAAAREHRGSTPQDEAVPQSLTVIEAARYVAAHYLDPRDPADALAEFGLEALERRRVSRLSGGQRRLVALALAFLGRPRLVLLDEPTAGLDAAVRLDVVDRVAARVAADGAAMIVTSHYLDDIARLAGRVAVLDRGRVVADGRTEDVAGERGLDALLVDLVRRPRDGGAA